MKTSALATIVVAFITATSALPQEQLIGNQAAIDAIGVGPGNAQLVFTAWTEPNFQGRKVEHRSLGGCGMPYDFHLFCGGEKS